MKANHYHVAEQLELFPFPQGRIAGRPGGIVDASKTPGSAYAAHQKEESAYADSSNGVGRGREVVPKTKWDRR